jgi:hypothetical protein
MGEKKKKIKKVGNIEMSIGILLKFCQIPLIYCYLYHIFAYRVKISASKIPKSMPFIPRISPQPLLSSPPAGAPY